MPSNEENPEQQRAQSQLFDWEAMHDYYSYVKNAVLRHKLLALGTFVVTAALGWRSPSSCRARSTRSPSC